jgi:glycerol-3-phosphate dehydrogenase (NAD(P)+)
MRIAILGSGAWGTALSLNLAGKGESVTLWSHSPAQGQALERDRENRAYLPGFPLPQNITLTTDMRAAAESEILVSVMPSEHVRATYSALAPILRADHVLISATKGVEDETCLRMSEVITDVLAGRGLVLPISVLSGPSFAQEVALGAPAAVTLACTDTALATRLQQELSTPSLRLYRNDDVVGVELGGALKNVIAIAAGVVAGLGLGHNTAAALITRGIAEITRLALACGGRRETLAGLSGIGDLVLTSTGALSRNRMVGMELGRGRALEEILTSLNGKVAEGVRTTAAALGLARRYNVTMPITEQVAAVLAGTIAPMQALEELMTRPGRDE